MDFSGIDGSAYQIKGSLEPIPGGEGKTRVAKSGDKYDRTIFPKRVDGGEGPVIVDVYSVLDAFDVASAPRAHAIKKLLAAGLRSKGSELQDLREAIDAIERDIDLVVQRDAIRSQVIDEMVK